MKTSKFKLYILMVIILVLIITTALFFALKDVTNQSNNTFASGSVLSGLVLTIKAFGIWQKIVEVFWKIITFLIMIFVLCGIGICLGC